MLYVALSRTGSLRGAHPDPWWGISWIGPISSKQTTAPSGGHWRYRAEHPLGLGLEVWDRTPLPRPGDLRVRHLPIDGVDLLDSLQHERAARPRQLAPELVVTAVVTDDAAKAEQVLEDALAAGHEGVVVTDVDSTHAAGRRGAAWRKVKPVRTYDLVVLGAEWGHGRRQGRLSNLHLGARDPGTGGFVMVGKTSKGLTDLLAWQTEALPARETAREGIAVLVAPELVIEIAIDGVQSSTRYPGEEALLISGRPIEIRARQRGPRCLPQPSRGVKTEPSLT